MSGQQTIVIDDADPTNIIYSSGWHQANWSAPAVNKSGFLTFSDDIGVQFTVFFPQPAISFTYFGFNRCCGGFYQICVDCEFGNSTWVGIDAVKTDDDGMQPPVALYSQSFKIPGMHTVTVRNQPDSRFNGTSQITVDRFELVVGPGNSSTEQPPAAPGNGTTLGGPVSENLGTKKKTVGGIAGGVVGGVITVIGAVLLLLWLRKRRAVKRAQYAAIPFVTSPLRSPGQAQPVGGVQVGYHDNPQSPQQPSQIQQQQLADSSNIPRQTITLQFPSAPASINSVQHDTLDQSRERTSTSTFRSRDTQGTSSVARLVLNHSSTAIAPPMPHERSDYPLIETRTRARADSQRARTTSASSRGTSRRNNAPIVVESEEIDAGHVDVRESWHEPDHEDNSLPPNYNQLFGNADERG